jgi:hypothetical protein
MHDDRKNFFYAICADMFLLGQCASQRHGINRLKMAGIGNQVRANDLAFARAEFAGCALVIFNVAAAEHAAGINILKSGKNVVRRNTDNQAHYRKAAAMAHGHDRGCRAQLCASFQDRV